MNRRVLVALSTVFVVLVAACSTGGSPERASSESTGAAIPTIVVLDASESMQKDDAPGPRWTAAIRAVDELVGGLPSGTDFSMVLFGADMSAKTTPRARGCTDVRTAIPMSAADQAAVSRALADVTPQGFTPIGTALDKAAEQLPSSGPASVVLVSDGAPTCDPDPCQVAERIRAQHPETAVSAIGFRTDAAALQCVAREGGGVFLTAENAAQLSARLAALQNTKVATERLTPTSRGGVELGKTLDEIRSAEPSFPTTGTAAGDRLVVVWRDCTYVFDKDRRLVEIAPGDRAGSAGVTIDGVGKGTPGRRAVELYGKPVSDADSTAVFVADKEAGTGYRIGYEGGSKVADGTVTGVVLCHCLPADEPAKPDPVLGRDKFDWAAYNFGTVRPTGFSIASTAASSVGEIVWESWGEAEAVGSGTSQQNGAGEPKSKVWMLASDLGWCDGKWAYRGLQRAMDRGALRTNEEVLDICNADRSTPNPAARVTLSPSSVLTFGGAGGVYVGDPVSKIPNTYVRREEAGMGMYPPGTVFFYFRPGAGADTADAEIWVNPEGRIHQISWFVTDRGIRIGSRESDVDRAYSRDRRSTCTIGDGSSTPVFSDPSGRTIVVVIQNGVVTRLRATQAVSNGAHCPFE